MPSRILGDDMLTQPGSFKRHRIFPLEGSSAISQPAPVAAYSVPSHQAGVGMTSSSMGWFQSVRPLAGATAITPLAPEPRT